MTHDTFLGGSSNAFIYALDRMLVSERGRSE